MVFVSVYSQHLPCVLPQHAHGPKHQRRIVLESWQKRIIERAPWPFIRGCIRTDGCCFVNRTGPYEYLSYAFTNMSEDIVRMFVGACTTVGVVTRATNGGAKGIWNIRINRRASVDLMLEHVGTKE
jgi:hypothetical protein